MEREHKRSLKKSVPVLILAAAALIHALYYVSAVKTGTLDPLFENITPGQDFYQVPNGAFAYLKGGSLQGRLPEGQAPYAACCGVNRNVYHPLFTLLVGTPLSKLSPSVSYVVWVGFHLLVSLYLLSVLYRTYGKHPLIIPSLCMYLLFSYHYYEIKMAQYHFLVMAFIFLHLLELERKNDVKAGVFLFLSLLVKPIGLLFFIPILLGGRLKTAITGAALFAAVTVPTVFIPGMDYYTKNFQSVASSDIISYNLYALTHFLPGLMLPLMIFKFFSAGFLIAYQIIRKPPLYVILTAWAAFQILFYGSVFPYHFVTFAAILSLGMVEDYIKPGFLMGTALLLLSIPHPAWYFHLRGSPSVLPTGEYLSLGVGSSAALLFFVIVLIVSNRGNPAQT